jgi:hypothetical protein
VNDLIRLAGCEATVRVTRIEERSKHFVFVLAGPLGEVRMTMSHGGGSRAGKALSMRGNNIQAIRSVAGDRKSA